MLIIAIILGFLFFLVFVLACYALDSALGDLDFSSNWGVIKQVAGIIREKNLEQSVLYDLGSARGNFALKILNVCPSLKVYGIDNSRFRTYFARFRALTHSHNPQFIRQDIFKTDLSKADIVFMYLEQSLVLALEKKLTAELKPGAIVIINNTHFAHWPRETLYFTDKNNQNRGRVFVYTKV